MSFLDTVPAAITRLDGRGPWARFRVTEERQRVALLRELLRGDVPLTLGPAGSTACRGVIWALDDAAGWLQLRAEPGADLSPLAAAAPLWAAGYLNAAKLQFELLPVRPQPVSPGLLQVALPVQMVHLPRRRALRVRRPDGHGPMAHFEHPAHPRPEGGGALRLAVADISMTGVGLWKPQVRPLLSPGTELPAVRVALDPGVEITADLRVAQLSPAHRSGGGLRVGCEWRAMTGEAAETLQRWIARGSRRRGMVSLSFD